MNSYEIGAQISLSVFLKVYLLNNYLFLLRYIVIRFNLLSLLVDFISKKGSVNSLLREFY